MSRGSRVVALCAVVVALSSACAPSPAAPALVEYGHSFGFCVGYCDTSVHPSGSSIAVTMTDRRTGAALTHSGTLTETGAARLAGALSTIDVSSLLPVYGCPDCADGGAASVTVRSAAGEVTTRYEVGRPPAALADLDAIGGELLSALRSCRSTAAVTVTPPCVAV